MSNRTYDADGITLERVREHVWEIPQEGEMRVPARVLASEALLDEISEDKTLGQIKNVTHLPGIRKHAVCMPDGHQGYGFPVGGVAAIDAETGCISPGGVGYDINCLTGDSEINLEFGRRATIQSLADRFEDEEAISADRTHRGTASGIRLFTETEDREVFKAVTETGDTVEATADHPFLTPDGMVELGELEPGEPILIRPFVGLPDDTPEDFVVLSEGDFADEDPQLLKALKERDLLPLTSTDEAFNHLLKLVGFHTGDGSFSGSQSWFYGSPEDLETIREDIEALGFTPSRIYDRDREHTIDGRTFERTEYSVRSTSNAFKQLLIRLGAPSGPKVTSSVTTPAYLDRLAKWQKALYLSGLFGAEMAAPATGTRKNLYCPEITHTRAVEQQAAGRSFMGELKDLLSDLGIDTNALGTAKTSSNRDHETIRFRFGISSDPDNLIRFFTTVGYRYAAEKQRRAIKAAQYLKLKERVIDRRAASAAEARVLADGGMPISEIKQRLSEINGRFIERSVYEGRASRPRPPLDFPDFDDFCEDLEIRNDLAVPVRIEDIVPAGKRTVYDIGIEHEAHNFVANGFVVSNCGVRMITSNLRYEDIVGHEEDLVDALYDRVPTGLGKGGVVETDMETIEQILARGMDWALEEGYAIQDDLEHCEDEGYRPDAEPEHISEKAKDRGRAQIGSLGSGNHFLEVQRVEEVYRDDVAEAYDLEPDQVVVLIHTGSRGMGHQTCTDYLRKIEKQHADLLSQLPDKELAAAPAGSQLAEEYYGAMCACINYAWTNRQLATYATRQVFEDVLGTPWEDLDMYLLYDVAHNIAKKEVHDLGDEERELYVHRKGATRAFPAGHPEIPDAYRDVGQPIIIPGSMGTSSYILRGGAEAMGLTFGSTAHGAGRLMSRTEAKKTFWGEDVQEELEADQQVFVRAHSGATIAEEAPGVYKDVDEVVGVSDALGIGDKVARTRPVCNIKG